MLCIIILNVISFILSRCNASKKEKEPIRQYNKPDKEYKSSNYIRQSELIETLQDQLNEFILPQRLQDAALHKHYGIGQNKRLSDHKFRKKLVLFVKQSFKISDNMLT